ncbi:DsbA family oxidoreductase [Chryseobacterium sp. PBS4-4]|uniref:DsbA family oxidoreductase n=1 Tax=Chryseobacterium edaphi TaxID=2976532 RepID=A0ABT2W5G0_9FLAO|nr:DsbA family oxidoreductase [Chryseobacterium edaphi]MCU7616624.1 DsbA family oxidoreductase [Chryseobacterium edaphi]
MKIEIWSDVMCPFCYIGKKNFEQALENVAFKNEVEVEWKSFQLDPTLELTETKTTAEYFREKKGFPEEQAKQMTAQVVQMGKASGIDFNFEKALITNTFPAHKLLHLAKKHNKASEMEEELFKAHFLNGENLGSIKFLSNLAEKLGINKDAAVQTLSSDEFDYDVNQDIMEGRNNGVTGVPFFILNGKYAVSGAQPSQVFEEALTQTYNETVKPFKGSSESELSCDTDGCSI